MITPAFLLENYTGEQDKLLNNLKLLMKQISTFKCSDEALADGLCDYNNAIPFINHIDKTHLTFINPSYRPHIPIAFDYFKVAGSGNYSFGGEIEYNLPTRGQFMADMFMYVKLSRFSAVDDRDRVRYISFLGHRFFEHTRLMVNGGALVDEVIPDDYNDFYAYEVPPHKRDGWKRMVGQEIPHLGYVTPDPTFDMYREYRWIGDGNQTLKYTHESIELVIPLIHWFCKHIQDAIPNYMLAWGNTQIKTKISDIQSLVGYSDNGGGGAYTAPTIEACDLYINNIFTIPEIYKIYKLKHTFNIIRLRKHQTNLLTTATGHILLHAPKFATERLNFAFRPVSNKNHSQYWNEYSYLTQKNVLVPVTSRNTILTGDVVSATSTTALLTGALSGTAGEYVNYTFVITGGAGYNSVDIVYNRYTVTGYNGANTITVDGWTSGTPNATSTYELFTYQLAKNYIQYMNRSDVVKKIKFVTYGEDEEVTALKVYNSYISNNFGKDMNTPDDQGLLCRTFSLYPLNRQPSGYVNMSLLRECYLDYESDVISSSVPVELVITSHCINFISVNDGRIWLEYLD
jgi:hypothetical protein